MIRDPEIFKQISIKDFDHFEDHFAFTDASTDKLWGNTLFFLNGQRWRRMRATVSPAFTGSKIRQMLDFKSEHAVKVVNHFLKLAAMEKRIKIDLKDFFNRYTADVIATSAFGLKVDSFIDPENEFFLFGRIFDSPSKINILQSILMHKFRRFARLLGIQHMDRSTSVNFKKLILDTIEIRQKNQVHRPDLMYLLIQAKDGMLKRHFEDKGDRDSFAVVEESDVVGRSFGTHKWDDDAIVGQCFSIYASTIHTTSTTLTFIAYELTRHQMVQKKLAEEIDAVTAKLNGKPITYEVIQEMRYLDQVVCETLRRWPPLGQLERLCVKDYVFDNGKDLRFAIEKGTRVLFPIYGMHHDPKYFPQPNKFDPERFNDVNKHNIVPGTYLPFGGGPRNCIGMLEKKTFLG